MTAQRARWIGTSTKMYFGYQRHLDWMTAVASIVDERPALADAGITPFVIPSFPVLESALRILGPAGVTVGAQAVSQDEGAATGEVSAGILAEMGVRLVEIGHAERRARYGESDEVVAAKTRASIAAGLTPLLCVGEPDGDDPAGAVRIVVEQCLAAVGDAALLDRIVVAYEPVWAIGAPAPAGADYVNEVVAGIRSSLTELIGGPAPSIVYGGSAGPGLLATVPEVDGLFLGRFAHDPANFGRVLDEALAL
ncbi:MAG: triose-phosphate isomerase family protein [Microbacteriaceae bacterium]